MNVLAEETRTGLQSETFVYLKSLEKIEKCNHTLDEIQAENINLEKKRKKLEEKKQQDLLTILNARPTSTPVEDLEDEMTTIFHWNGKLPRYEADSLLLSENEKISLGVKRPPEQQWLITDKILRKGALRYTQLLTTHHEALKATILELPPSFWAFVKSIIRPRKFARYVKSLWKYVRNKKKYRNVAATNTSMEEAIFQSHILSQEPRSDDYFKNTIALASKLSQHLNDLSGKIQNHSAEDDDLKRWYAKVSEDLQSHYALSIESETVTIHYVGLLTYLQKQEDRIKDLRNKRQGVNKILLEFEREKYLLDDQIKKNLKAIEDIRIDLQNNNDNIENYRQLLQTILLHFEELFSAALGNNVSECLLQKLDSDIQIIRNLKPQKLAERFKKMVCDYDLLSTKAVDYKNSLLDKYQETSEEHWKTALESLVSMKELVRKGYEEYREKRNSKVRSVSSTFWVTGRHSRASSATTIQRASMNESMTP